MVTLHENQYKFFKSRSFLLRMRNVQDKVVEKIKTHILYSITFSENRALYEITWKNIAEPDRIQMAIWRMRIACWIPKATNTHSEYVILFFFFTAIMAARARLVITLYVRCLSCLFFL
jgi:hypothetical protein